MIPGFPEQLPGRSEIPRHTRAQPLPPEGPGVAGVEGLQLGQEHVFFDTGLGRRRLVPRQQEAQLFGLRQGAQVVGGLRPRRWYLPL